MMNNTKEKKKTRKRSANFSYDEQIELLKIISNFKRIVECKKTDAATSRAKDQTWIKITNMFNSCSPNLVYRSKESLKKFYDNKKKRVRRSVANQSVKLLQTEAEHLNPEEKRTEDIVLSITNKKTIDCLENKFDSDGRIDLTETTMDEVMFNHQF